MNKKVRDTARLASIKSLASLMAVFLLLPAFDVQSQGILRTHGLGVRTSYWEMSGRPSRFSVSQDQAVFDLSGLGGWLNYYSRLHQAWYLELNLGSIATVSGSASEFLGDNVDVSVLVPFLTGLRYYVLPLRNPSRFQPFLTTGLGPYWYSSFHVQGVDEETVTGEIKARFGGYLGGGSSIMLSSWLALNLEMKYHFVDLKPLDGFEYDKTYSGLDFGLGFSFMWGSKHELFQIKGTSVVVRDLYPAYYNFYNTYPVALVSVKNIAGYPIEVNVQSNMPGYSERPRDSGFVKLEKGETKDIPVTLIFGERLRNVAQRQSGVLDIRVEGRAGGKLQKAVSAQVMVHNRNAWNGEIDKLGFFVTPEEDHIFNLSRAVSNNLGEDAAGNLAKAQAAFEELAKMGLRYHRDPNIPFYRDDRVQFAHETLDLRMGDCDDLVVLYASLLESMGINTAFVEVRDPDKEIAHLFLLFDTDVASGQSEAISSNEKRFVVRENQLGKSSIWIPVETTLVAQGFEPAWKSGAMQYLQDGVVRGGLMEGWMRVIDVQ